MEEEKAIVKYKAKDGQEISLGFKIVRDYLVQGDREKVTPQELMFFMGMCKSRGLNPFKKDAYLIKYGVDPAAIVVSIDYFRARARAQADCKGWKAGVIIKKNESYVNREGSVVYEGEKLIGGWFEAKPAGWDQPRFHSVNLKGYIKRTKEGHITRFWSEENQPSQIMKVAESQGLRMVWPDEFQELYSEEEIEARRQLPEDVMAAAADKARQEAIEKFKASIPKPFIFEHPSLQEFLSTVAQANRCSIDDVMIEASGQPEDFWKGYEEWLKENQEKNQTPEAGPPTQEPKPTKENQSPEGGPPPFSNHAQADAEIAKKDTESEKKNGKKGKARSTPAKQMIICARKFSGKQVAAIFCASRSCPDKECEHWGEKERTPGEEG